MRKPKSLKFSLNKSGAIYARYTAVDGKVDKAIGRKCTKEEWINETYDKGTARLMDRLELLVDELKDSRDDIQKKVSKSEIEAIIDTEAGRETAKGSNLTLLEGLTMYRDYISNGTIKKENGTLYAASYKRLADALIAAVKDTPLEKIRIDKFTAKHYEDFFQLLLTKVVTTTKKVKKRYSQNTMYLYSYILISFFKRTKSLKWHKNLWWDQLDTKVKKDYVEGHVYLTRDEIAKVYSLELTNPKWAYARDVFVLGCQTCLRHIDMGRLSSAVIKDGVLEILAQKGGRKVVIPLSSMAKEIWNRYGGKFGAISNHIFNERIRLICKAAGLDQECLYVRIEGGVRKEKKLPKWRMTGTHTMRRSFATNAVKAGVPIQSIMRIGGWRSESSFQRYLRLSGEEHADLMKGHEFFS